MSYPTIQSILGHQETDDKAKVIEVLEHPYKNSKAYIMLDTTGEKFNLEIGVKQGDLLSPNLFNCVQQLKSLMN